MALFDTGSKTLMEVMLGHALDVALKSIREMEEMMEDHGRETRGFVPCESQSPELLEDGYPLGCGRIANHPGNHVARFNNASHVWDDVGWRRDSHVARDAAAAAQGLKDKIDQHIAQHPRPASIDGTEDEEIERQIERDLPPPISHPDHRHVDQHREQVQAAATKLLNDYTDKLMTRSHLRPASIDGTQEYKYTPLDEYIKQHTEHGTGPYHPVDKPAHYDSDVGIECIDAIRAALGEDGFRTFCRGQVLKYTWRAGTKHSDTREQDMSKAKFYASMAAGVDPRTK